ncbi:fasciclin domain-containing protein [Leptolyngbya sp. NIES-2104]|uniref:fasciclin domain-containing protein n=1 Tax=Leptolyngbya sp. NIES-2104 TaxID=1552121 RepID=UPI0006ECC226|nr:fasciclin domain-containing protein [Leptolyngbya sp. NIES-2104]GAP95803.1 sensory subunit of low CO2-induced protein complex, putative [Leptolyngbya sp. NIES-2104]
MKTSLKRLTTGLSALGLSLSLALPSVAQSQSTPNAETTPANTPETPAPGNRDTGVPPIGGQSGENTPGTITSPENSNNNGGTTTNPGVPNNQSVPGTVSPANRPENNNLPGSGTTPSNSPNNGGTINPGVPNNQSVPGTVSPANRPENNNLPGSSSTTTTPPVSVAGSEGQTLDQIVRTSPSFELFNALLRVAESNGSFTALAGSGDFTVFAPTDEALAAVPPATFKALVQPENRALLVQVLENHIVRGKVTSADLASKQVQSLGGNPLSAQGGAGSLSVGNAQVVGADIQAENGIIHAVNGVILPAELQSKLTSLAPQAGMMTP